MEIIFSKNIKITMKNQRLQKIFIKIESALLLLASLFIFGNCDLKVKTDNAPLMKMFSLFQSNGANSQIGISVVNAPTSITENQSVQVSVSFSTPIRTEIILNIVSSNPAITVNNSDKTILTFNATNGTVGQIVTLKAIEDANLISEQAKVSLSAMGYTDLVIDIATTDDDTQNISITGANSLDEGASSSISISLTKQPSTNVMVSLSSGDTSALTIGSSTLTFTSANYNTPQTVTINSIADVNQISDTVTITASATGIASKTWDVLSKEYIRGTISGLTGTLILQNNGGDDLTVSANGNFVFNTPTTSLTYNVSAKTYLYGKICTISGASGSNIIAGSNIAVSCSNLSYATGGSALGLINTGQTTVYAAGDDGTHQKTMAKAYTDNGDGTVTDNVTGLIWQKCSNGLDATTCLGSAVTLNWTTAKAYCTGLSLASKTWRLPTVQELSSLVDASKSSNPINATAFPSTQLYHYWNSTPYVHNTPEVWVNVSNGGISPADKMSLYYVRCISGQSSGASSFTDNTDGTITDSATKLVWQKCSSGLNATTCSGTETQLTWANAIVYCTSLSLASRSWRLPNRNELHSLVDYAKTSYPAIDTTAFPNQSSNYWSSTTYAPNTSYAWFVDPWGFVIGNAIVGLDKSSNNSVRCVSGP